MCDLDGGKWVRNMLERQQMQMKSHFYSLFAAWPNAVAHTQKIVLSNEELYDTFIAEWKKREWKDFAEYKHFMLDKYYVDEAFLDLLLKPADEEECEGGASAE